jgi:hypothetical protein
MLSISLGAMSFGYSSGVIGATVGKKPQIHIACFAHVADSFQRNPLSLSISNLRLDRTQLV